MPRARLDVLGGFDNPFAPVFDTARRSDRPSLVRIGPPTSPRLPRIVENLLRLPGCTTILWTVLLGLVAAIAGCTVDSARAPLVFNACAADSDCLSGRCDKALDMCVDESPVPKEIAIEVTPRGSELSAVEHTFQPLEFAEETEWALVLPRPTQVFGRARWRSRTSVVQATVEFVGGRKVAGLRIPAFSTQVLPMARFAADGREADYVLRVAPDETYDVVVRPVAEDVSELPPLRFDGVRFSDDVAQRRVDLEYPQALTLVEGRVVDAEGGVDGLQVQAYQDSTGRLVSSTSVTGSGELPSGHFRVRLAPGAGEYSYRIRAGSDRPTFPTIVVDRRRVEKDGEVVVPRLNPIRYEARVEGAGEGPKTSSVCEPSSDGLADVTVFFSSMDIFDSTTGLTGSFRATTATDACGNLSLDLFAGTYEVVLTPPDRSGRRVVVASVKVAAPPEGDGVIRGQLFMLGPVGQVFGSVVTPDGRPMPGAVVQALPVVNAGGALPQAARHGRSANAVTDDRGIYRLGLDFGVYDLVVKPPVQSGFAWTVRRGLVIDASTRLEVAFEVPIPVVRQGTARAFDGAPLSGAEIRAFALANDRAVPIGLASSNADGVYRLLLPPTF